MATYTPDGRNGVPPAPGASMASQEGAAGLRDGKYWLPPEGNTSVRPGWFWYKKEKSRVNTPRQLMDLYYSAVGRRGCLLLNLPLDRRALIHENDAASGPGFNARAQGTFRQNLVERTKATASNLRARDARVFGPRHLLDGDRHTYWARGDAARTPEVTFDLGKAVKFNVIGPRENIKRGLRIDSVAREQGKDGSWVQFEEATSIGACRLIRTKEEVATNRVRRRFTRAAACPALSEFGLLLEPGEPA